VIPEPFAKNADPAFIQNPIPQTTGVSGRASYDQGFPAITMQPVAAGGKPPFGQDFNGLFFALTSQQYFAQAGQLWPYNATVAAAISGYGVGSVLSSSDGITVWLNTVNGNMTDPDSGSAAGWVSLFTYGYTTKTVSGGGSLTLTPQEARAPVIIINGALTGNQTVVLPLQLREWLIVNNTSGSFVLTIRGPSGAGVTIPQGGFSSPVGVYSEGANFFPTVPAASLIPADQNATPLTLAQRTNAGYLLATYFNQSSPIENPPVGAVFVQNTSGDGFLRKASLGYLESVMALQSIGGQVQPSQIVSSAVTQFTSLILASAALTGVPTAPTAPTGTASSQVATTAFVNPPVTISGNSICIPLANGYKLQMGFASGGQHLAVTFPQAFTTRVWFAAAATSPRSVMGGQGTNFTDSVTLFGMNITVDPSPGSGYWIAIGQ